MNESAGEAISMGRRVFYFRDAVHLFRRESQTGESSLWTANALFPARPDAGSRDFRIKRVESLDVKYQTRINSAAGKTSSRTNKSTVCCFSVPSLHTPNKMKVLVVLAVLVGLAAAQPTNASLNDDVHQVIHIFHQILNSIPSPIALMTGLQSDSQDAHLPRTVDEVHETVLYRNVEQIR
jgi:hypothetical protein